MRADSQLLATAIYPGQEMHSTLETEKAAFSLTILLFSFAGLDSAQLTDVGPRHNLIGGGGGIFP